MTWADWWGRFKIFCWYLATEPWRQLRDSWRILRKLWAILTRTLTWAYAALALTIVAILLGHRVLAGLFLLCVLLAVLVWEWQSGFFIHRYREHTARQVRRTLEQTEAHRNAPYRPRRRPPHDPLE